MCQISRATSFFVSIAKLSNRCFCYFTASMFVPLLSSKGTNTVSLYKALFSVFTSHAIKTKTVTIQWIKSRILDMIDDWYINNLAKNQVSAVFHSRVICGDVSPKFIAKAKAWKFITLPVTKNPVELKHCEKSSSHKVFYSMKLKPQKEE